MKHSLPSPATVQRYIKAALAAGLNISGFEVRPSGEVIVHTAAETASGPDAALAAWERANAKRKA